MKENAEPGGARVRKFLQVLGGLTLLIVVVGGIGVGLLIHSGLKLDAESKTYVDEAVAAIATTWDKTALLDRAAPELTANVTQTQLEALFRTFSQRMGPLIEYQGSSGQANVMYSFNSGSRVSASYLAQARFQNTNATFRIVLVKRDDRWMIYNFHVEPEPSGAADRPV